MGIELPHEYAPRRARERLAIRWQDELGRHVRAWGPVVWPDVPPVALLAWTVTSTGPTELGPAPDFVCGAWGVEREALPALQEAARPLLGRTFSRELTPRGYLGDLEAQTVSGLLRYKAKLDAVARKAPPHLLDDRTTSWAWRVAAASYSSGQAVPRALLSQWPAVLAATPAPARWAALARLVSEHPARTIGNVRVRGKWRAAFAVLRAEQRAAAAVHLARAVLSPSDADALVAWVDDWSARDDARPTLERLRQLADGDA